MNLYPTGVFQVVKIDDANKLEQNTENDPITKNQIANLGCFLMCTFGSFLALVLVAAHTLNNLDLSLEKSFENKDYESD